ncbi:MAG: enoyl-CoA hydratase-related protein [Thermodesulfobacteriota bacterium]
MESTATEVSRQGALATVTLVRPEKHNRLDTQAMRALTEQLQALDAEPQVRVVLITGAGDQAFCAGADIGEFDEAGVMAQRKQAEAFRGLCLALHQMHKPVLAKVNGLAVGGGMAMVSLAHLAVAADSARFGTPEINVGAFPNMVMTAILRSVPRKLALKMILLGEIISAQEALAMGLINAVVPRGQLDAVCGQLAERLAAKSPAVMALGLHSIRVSSDLPYPHAMEYLQEVGTIIRNTEDFREGAQAFMHKRPPQWKGR